MASGVSAELAVTSLTTEGDRIVRCYRVVPGRPGLEVFTDSTADKFAGTGWSYARRLVASTRSATVPTKISEPPCPTNHPTAGPRHC